MARKLLKDNSNRPAILYASSRREAEALASELNRDFPASAYHAGLDPGTRERTQRGFLAGDIQVVVATIAFGMGIDKADVRTVIHMSMPASVESYYQEIGRAGRDGMPARTVLMHSFADKRTHDFLLEKSYPPTDTLARIAAALRGEPIHADDLRIALKLDVEVFGAALDKLLAQGAAQIDFAGNVTRNEATASTAWRRAYDTQVNFRRGQIEAMMRFAGTSECRMAALIRHFGDSSDASRTCGLCDFCMPQGASSQAFRGPTRDESDELQRILRALSGAGGGKSTGKLHAELYPNGQRDRKDMDALLDALTRAGYASLESASFVASDGKEIQYRRAVLTHEGREAADEGGALAGVQMREIDPDTAPKARSRSTRKAVAEADSIPLNAEQKLMDAALRAWRGAEAKKLGKPAFVVFGDRTLRQIVQEAPRSLDELQGVSGIGTAKAERWGEAILSVLAAGPSQAVATEQKAGAVHSAPPATVAVRVSQSTVQPALNLPAAPSRPSPSQVPPAAERSQGLEYALKVWRMREAQRQSAAPFDLLRDKTLRDIAEAMPRSVADLRGVRGIESSWADRFGEAVCSLIAQHA